MASDGRRRLIVLGAGASYGAGLPDASLIAGHLFNFCKGPILPIRNRTPLALFDPLVPALIASMRSTGVLKGERWPLDAICGWFGEQLKRDRAIFPAFAMLFEAIAQLLYARSCEHAEGYRAFVAALRPSDIVVNLNWDVCVEVAMYVAQRDVHRELRPPPLDTPSILKPHGSVDYLIVETSSRDLETHTAEYRRLPDYVEPLQAQLPTVVQAGRTSRNHLFRLRTYDYDGQISTNWDPDTRDFQIDMQPGRKPFDPLDPDLGPFQIKSTLGTPTNFLLTPDLSDVLYEWSYSALLRAIQPVAADIESIVVAGYSFPEYDRRFLNVLERIAGWANYPVTQIVNPAVDALPRDRLNGVFRRTEYNAVKFAEFDWSR